MAPVVQNFSNLKTKKRSSKTIAICLNTIVSLKFKTPFYMHGPYKLQVFGIACNITLIKVAKTFQMHIPECSTQFSNYSPTLKVVNSNFYVFERGTYSKHSDEICVNEIPLYRFRDNSI